MSCSYGENIKVTIFGQSHSPAIGMTLEGVPAGEKIDLDRLNEFMARRAPGRNDYSTARKEADKPEFLAGLLMAEGVTATAESETKAESESTAITCGTPITAIIRNGDTQSRDYSELKRVPRPGHADFTADVKYDGFQDFAGGGNFSGRMTAPLCIAGGICLQLLGKEGIEIISRIHSIKDIRDEGELLETTAGKPFPVVSDARGEDMIKLISRAKENGDSVGGIVECVAKGVPAGVGNPIFDGIENKIAGTIFGIPAAKGIEFGAGFRAAKMFGSENNDPFQYEEGEVKTLTNNAGGILGGITNGMPIKFKVAFKPTPSIGKPQQSVDLVTGKSTELTIAGRHDPCIVHRAVPCVEAAAAIAIYDALIGRRREINGHAGL